FEFETLLLNDGGKTNVEDMTAIEFQGPLGVGCSHVDRPDVLNRVAGQVTLKRLERFGRGFDRDHSAGFADERRGEHRIVANIGSYIDERVSGLQPPRNKPCKVRFPNSEKVDVLLQHLDCVASHQLPVSGVGHKLISAPRKVRTYDSGPDIWLTNGQG